jgi:hypothetical protein
MVATRTWGLKVKFDFATRDVLDVYWTKVKDLARQQQK